VEKSSQLHALVMLHGGKKHNYPLYRRLGEPNSQSRCSGGKKKSLLPAMNQRTTA